LKIDKNSTDSWGFILQFGAAWNFVWGITPTKPPVATGLDLFLLLYEMLKTTQVLTGFSAFRFFSFENCKDKRVFLSKAKTLSL